MKERDQLASLYEEWRLLSEAEGDAIRSVSWQRVDQCQRAKADLQGRILQAIEGAAKQCGDAEEVRRFFRPVLQHLISLEMRNSEWLGAERAKLEATRTELNRAQRSVRQLRSTYGNLQTAG